VPTATVPETGTPAISASIRNGLNWLFSVEGTFYDHDGVHGSQCIDLIQGYYVALGASAVRGNGSDYITNEVPAGFIRYAKSDIPNGELKPGDVFIRADTSGGGHVGVIIAVTDSNITTMEANYGRIPNTATQNNNPVRQVDRGSKAVFMDYIWGIIRPVS
jgi:hypothetical protein